MSWIGVITNAGAALLAQWTAGDHSLTIDKATVGSGVRSVVNLRTATALAQEEADGSIVSAKPVTGGTQFRIRVSPAAVTAYTAHEIGIWGHLDDDESLTLIAIHQDADTGVEVPTAASMPSFQFDLYCLHAIGNEGELNITLTEEVYPTVDEMDAAIDSAIETIESKVAETEDTSTASQNYAVNDYLIYNDKLYKVTASISSGGTLTPGTNIEEATIGEELTFTKNRISNILGDLGRVEASAVATKNYAAGEYLILDGYLYKTKAAITSGTSLVIGTNIERTTVSTELDELNSNLNSLDAIKGFVYNATPYNYRLYIRQVKFNVNHNSEGTATYTPFPHAVLVAIPYCGHSGFSAASTVSVTSLSNGSITMKQFNSASAQMGVAAIIFGY